VCTVCEKESYSNAMSSVCVDCDLGKFSPAIDASSCPDCTRGRYQRTVGSSYCSLCKAGLFLDAEGSVTAEDCDVCVIGKTSVKGASICTDLSAEGSVEIALQLGGAVVGLLLLQLFLKRKWKLAKNTVFFSCVVSVLDV